MNKHILICEDDEGIIDVSKYILSEKGYVVDILERGENVVEKVKADKPAVILMDLWMPDINGADVTKALKTNEETKGIPIIIVSANRETEKIAREAGADDFLAKPFDIEELEKKVDQYTK